MQWTGVEQEQLHRFLEGFSSPHPAVQLSNPEQLQALSQHPSALVSTLAIVCDAAVSVTVRLSATTVARQLLRCGDRLPLYLSAAGNDPATAAQSIAEALFDAAFECASSLSSMTTVAPLQRSTGSLIACLLRSLADTSLAAIATAVWSRILSSLLHRTDPATFVVNDTSEDGHRHTAQFGARCAALLREICEVPLSTSKVLREWVGGQAAESLALCSLFSQQLQLLERQMEVEHATSGDTARLNALWLEETLAAFQLCVESGVLPCESSEFSSPPTRDRLVTSSGSDSSRNTDLGEGPSAQGLRAVCTAVVSLQNSAQGLILRRILGPLKLLNAQRPDRAFLREAVVSAAPFMAVAMRYMADAVALDAMKTLRSAFHATATPLLASFCRAVCLAELQYDGAGESDSVHAAVLACLMYLKEWVSTECARLETPSIRLAAFSPPPSAMSTPTEDHVSCLCSMLVDAATLPSSVAGALEVHTAHQPDSAAEFLAKSASGRRRERRSGHAQKTHESWDSTAPESEEETVNVSAIRMSAKRDERDDILLADPLEVALPDSGTLRQAVVWCAVGFSCEKEWMMAVAPLVMRLATTSPLSSLAAACRAESALLLQNEFLDGILADNEVSASLAVAAPEVFERNLAEQVQSIVSLLSPLTQDDLGTRTPFFVCIQAVRYLGRLVIGLLGAWQHTFITDRRTPDGVRVVERTRTVMLVIGGFERLLGLVLGRLTAEVNKAVQVECVKTLSSTLASCLKVMEQLMRGSANGSDTSDIEEESLDSTSTSSSDAKTGDGGGDAASHLLQSDPCEWMCAFCRSFGATMDLRAIVEVLHVVSSHIPSFQWSVRQAVYHLFSEVLPSLWRAAPLVDSLFASRTDGTCSAASNSARIVTIQVLEVLAQQYTSLLRVSSTSGSSSPMLEMATLLTTMADVTSAMDGGALEVVVPWILQVTHHILHLYADYLTHRAHTNQSLIDDSAGGVVDMTDICMVSLDLVSSMCDGVIDRDALLEQQLRPEEAGGAFGTMDARMIALATSLLLPLSSSGIGCGSALNSDGGAEALPNRCMALLVMCQSLSDHPTRVSPKSNNLPAADPVEDEALCCLDEFGEVRRGCFAILYDCAFLAAYPSSLFRPLGDAVAPGTESLSIPSCLSDSLGRDLCALCMREVLPSIAPLFGTRSAEYEAHFRFVSAHNVAASDAWLCLGSLLSLWDQQHWQTSRRAPNGERPIGECERGPGAVFCAHDLEFSLDLHSHCLHTLNELLALLQDKRTTLMTSMRLNMTTAACGLAVLLCYSDRSYTDSGAQAPMCTLPFATVSAAFLVVSSTRIQEYAADPASGDLSGINEAAHVLWCLGRLWQGAVQPLPHDALCTFLRSHGKEIAKTISWWARCAFGAKQRLTPPDPPVAPTSAPFWGSLLELWRPVALTLLQAVQGGVLSLTQAQLSVLDQLQRL